MIRIQGTGISAGVAEGPLYFFRRSAMTIRRGSGDPSSEMRRLGQARQSAIAQLKALSERCRSESGEDSAALFETHAMLVSDEDYVESIRSTLETERCCAEYAVQQAGEYFAGLFTAMNDPYMQARAADIRDVSRRIISNLSGEGEQETRFACPVILAADDLSPSETIRLDRSMILAFATREGSGNSHTAILARTMGIPAVCGLGDGLNEKLEGRPACVDGASGELIIDPDGPALSVLRERKEALSRQRAQLEALRDQPDETPDGRRIDLCCNVGSSGDIPAVLACGAHGIGLFRSEFLYLAAERPPAEEEQFRAYSAVAAAMKGKRVIIRTLDVGADKQVGYFNLKKEENPALGLRAVRLCLNRPDIFRPQLRALCRASACGRIAIMFPMIASVWEVHACRRACEEVMAELDAEGVPFDRGIKIGVMIETPASVFIADELAREADFFSVGTNDLTQYILACDRQTGNTGGFFDPRHPAVLRALKTVAGAARRAGIPVNICGDLAADPELLPFFLDIGINELSVPPSAVLPLRAAIRSLGRESGSAQQPFSV